MERPGGYQWPVLEVSCYGGAEVQPGDLVTVEDIAGNSLSVPVMEVSLSVDGGCRCALRSYGKGDTARGADSIGPRELRLQRVEQTAGVAMQSANGKNKVFHQASAPAASVGLTAGDIWFDTANGNRLSTWTGSAWSAFTLQDAAISNLNAGAITTGRLSAARIDVEGIFALDVTATGIIRGSRFTTGGRFSVDQQGVLNSEQGSFSECEMSNGYIGTCSCEDLLFSGGWIAGPGGGVVEDIYDFRAYRYGTDDSGGLVIEAGFPEVVQPLEEEVEPLSYSTPEDMWSNVGSSPVQIARFFLDSSSVGHAYFGQVHASRDLDVSGAYKRNGNPLLVVEQKRNGAYCGGNAANRGSIDVDKDGYTPIGIVGYEVSGGNNYMYIDLYRLTLESNTSVGWSARNSGAGNFSGTITVSVLYMAN